MFTWANAHMLKTMSQAEELPVHNLEQDLTPHQGSPKNLN